MDLQLDDKTALVTGSTAGIGLAIAAGLAKEGASVFNNGRTEGRVNNALEKIKSTVPGARVRGIAADMGTAEGAAIVTSKLPHVDILVNNVGIFEPKAFEEIPDDDWFRIFEVNVMSGVRLSRHYLPRMKAQNWGRIIFVSSESAVQIPAEMIHYGVTKTAQLAVSRGLAETTKGTNVTVNTVLAGPTASEGVTDFVKKLAAERAANVREVEDEFIRNMRPTSLIQRFATPEEVANMVTYLSSPLSSATNGAALRVDGGVVLSIL